MTSEQIPRGPIRAAGPHSQQLSLSPATNDQSPSTSDQNDPYRHIGDWEETARLIVEASRRKATAEAQMTYLIEEFMALIREADREAESLADLVLDPTGD